VSIEEVGKEYAKGNWVVQFETTPKGREEGPIKSS
jgi:hypothetical protein